MGLSNLVGQTDLTAVLGNPQYSIGSGVSELPDKSFIVVCFEMDRTGNTGSKWELVHLPLAMDRVIDRVIVETTSQTVGGIRAWKHDEDGKWYVTVMCNEREAATGWFHIIPKTYGPLQVATN